MKRTWHGLVGTSSRDNPGLFHSARLKLTGFYLAIIIVFSLCLTLSIRELAEREIIRAGGLERGAVHSLLFNYYSVPPQPDSTFDRFQNAQNNNIRDRLNVDVLLVNLFALVGGGILSYWYAGRTLRPIEEAHEAQARFAADASHELRTPLASLKVENEVFLRQKSFKPEEARELINSNLEEVDRLEHLATNLLSLTQVGQAPLKLTRLSMSRVVETAVQLAEKQANKRQVKFKTNISDMEVIGNSDGLVQLSGLIIDNAIKYGPVSGTIHIDGVVDNGKYHLSIRDEGEGINKADLPHIFEKLYRGDKARSAATPGYGLGLSLAQELAKANKATIAVRNYPEGGAQFVLSLGLAKS